MALVLADRVRETTTTVGTGSVVLGGAVTGYQSFSVVGNGNTTYYCIAGQGTAEWEVGIGTYTSSGTTLARTTVLASSNSGSLVNFSAGTKDVFVTYPSEKSVNLDASGLLSAPAGLGTGVPTALNTAVGSAGAFVVNGGALGTPSSGTVTNLTGTASININGTVGATTPASGAFTSLSDSGNLTFTGTGNRITGDFSNTTQVNRVLVQSSTTNGNTQFGLIPNGTATTSGFWAHNNSDITNASRARFDAISTEVRVISEATGTGTYLPMTFYTSGAEKLRIAADTTGTYTFSGTAPRITGDFSNATETNRVSFQTSTANSNTIVSALPNGTAVSASFRAYNNSDPTNASHITIATTSAADARLTSGITGTGTYLPMTFYTSGSEKLRIAADTTGTITIGGTAPRITGDFSNATLANRVLFQTSTTNSGTSVAAIANGTPGTSQTNFAVFNGSNPANSSVGIFGINDTIAVLSSDKVGTGTYLPMTFYTGGSERMRLDTSGNLGIGNTPSGTYKLEVSGKSSATEVYATNGLHLNAMTISTSTTIPSGYSASSVGPISVANGVTVTVANGSRWVTL